MLGPKGTAAGLYYETLFWSDDGTPPIVLLPGLLSDGRQVRRLLRELRRKAVVLDPLGAGHSDAPPEPAEYLLPALVPRLHALLDTLAIHRADLVGLSMGGMWAQHALAADAKGRFRSAVLVATCGHISARLRSILLGLRALWLHDLPRLDSWRILQALLFSPEFLERPSTVPLLELLASEPKTARPAALFQLAALLDFNARDELQPARAELGQRRIVRAVVGAEHDMLMPPIAQRALQQSIGDDVAVHILPGAGHAAWIEQPAALANILRASLPDA
jgi:pimeloyl-ACP methyl ester carboxylesterase